MFIMQIASELAPLAKVGGLADVVYGLSKELIKKGHQTDIIIPKYDCIDYGLISDLKIVYKDLKVYYNAAFISCSVFTGKVEGLKIYLIEPHHEAAFFNRGTFYNCPDNIDRFCFFSRAALELIQKLEQKPDIIHCHDWHTALIPVLYHEMFKKMGLYIKGFIFTIHNLEHQGLTRCSSVEKVGLSSSYLLHFNKLQDPSKLDHLNLLKGAIVYSNYFTTVSPNYAKEVQTPLGGCGLHSTISYYHYKFIGILNGIDYEYWSPEKDPYLEKKYTYTPNLPAHLDKPLLEGKRTNKSLLREKIHFHTKEAPIVSCITRLVRQKGIHLIEHALFKTLELGGQFILLGTSPDPKINEHFMKLKVNLGHNHNVHFEMQYNESLSHLIFAGSDFFIIPSLFEPCGLTQIISLRYGTIPIVRNTGGLKDTVFDVDYASLPLPLRNGYAFDYPDFQGIEFALKRALHDWFYNKERIYKLIRQGISYNYSWQEPALQYLELYNRCVQ